MRSSTKRDEEKARELHTRATVFDAHSDIGVDILRRRMRGSTGILDRMRRQLKAGGITGALSAVWADSESYSYGGYGQAISTALRSIAFSKQETEACRGWALQARSVEDVRLAKRQAKTAFIFHLEGAMPLDEDLAYVRVFRELGVLSVGPVWNIRNQIADGIEQRAGSGLTNFGTMLVSQLDRSRIAIDVSHLSEKGFWDVLALSKRPVIASHSNARALCDNPRNLKDDQIRAIAEKQGVIGACFYSPFIDAKKPSLDRLLDHIDYIADLVGVNHIGLGADFTDYLAGEAVKTPSTGLVTGKAALNLYPKGIENASKMLNISRGLVSRGYSDDEILKILGENFLRVLRQIWGS